MRRSMTRPSRHLMPWLQIGLRVTLLACAIPGADAIITIDAVKRSMQTCALCMCITMCIFCAGFMLMWLWGKPEEEEEDEWAEWEEEQAALQAALEAANQ